MIRGEVSMLRTKNPNVLSLQTNLVPTELTPDIIEEIARGIALYYKDNNFVCQTFFTQPILGEVQMVDGLEKEADVYIRSIQMVGPNLFHVLVTGEEEKVHTMCRDKTYYELIRGIETTFTEDIRSRRFLDTTDGKNRWNILLSLDKKKYRLLNTVDLDKKSVHLQNIIILGDRLLGITDDHKVAMGHLKPELLEREETLLAVKLMDTINKLGKIRLLAKAPNSEDTFLVTVNNTIYQFNIWGEIQHFNTLDDDVKQINSITFNHTRSIMATSNGLYEMDVWEMPNMVRATSMPRQIVDPNLKQNFQLALYVEDPYMLGVNPALGIFAKTDKEKVLFF